MSTFLSEPRPSRSGALTALFSNLRNALAHRAREL